MMDTPWSILNARITRVIDRLDALPTFREATVAATSPLSVRFDTDSVDTLVFATLASGLAVGDRVLTLRFGRLPWVIGRRGGLPRVVGVGDWSGSLGSSTTSTAKPLTLESGSVGLTVSDGGLVVPRNGWYAVTGALWTAANGNGNRYVSVYVGESASVVSALWKPPSGTSSKLSASGLLRLSAGDVLTLRVWQSSGSTLSAWGRLSLNLVN